MSYFTISVDDKIIGEKISEILNTVLFDELESRYSSTNGEISQAVKELIYSHKDEIIDKVVDKATKEIVKKGLPKFIERIEMFSGDN